MFDYPGTYVVTRIGVVAGIWIPVDPDREDQIEARRKQRSVNRETLATSAGARPAYVRLAVYQTQTPWRRGRFCALAHPGSVADQRRRRLQPRANVGSLPRPHFMVTLYRTAVHEVSPFFCTHGDTLQHCRPPQ